VWEYTQSPAQGLAAESVVITFTEGIPTAIDGTAVTPLQAIEILNQIAGRHGVGRVDIIEDRLVGIKSREVYEVPGAITLINAHEELENLVLERDLGRCFSNGRASRRPWRAPRYG